MAKRKKKAVADWEQALRHSLKAVNGKGWSLRESRGRAQLVQILEDRSRRSTKLEIIWASKNVGEMLEAVAQIREYLDGGKDWDESVAARAELTDHSTGTTKATKTVNWESACDRFFKSRANRRSSTLIVGAQQDLRVPADDIGQVIDSLQHLVLGVSSQLDLALVVDRNAYGLGLATPCLLPLIDDKRRKFHFEARTRCAHLADALDEVLFALVADPQ